MEIYESFMTKNPVILKVNRTNLSSNGTINLTILNNNITEQVYTNSSDTQQKPETNNTESPFKVNITEPHENSVQNFSESNVVTQNHTNFSLSVLETSKENQTTSYKVNNTTNVEDNKTVSNEGNNTVSNEANQASSNEANKTTIDGTKKPEVAPVGFFGQVSNTVTNIFHSLTSWF